jgi:tetratricopeptide (TPR) repeat protein
MRKVIAALIMVVVLAAVAWWVWRTWSTRSKPLLVLTLQVDRKSEVAVLERTPLFFTVFLSGSKAAPRLSIGSSDHPWHERLHLEPINNEKLLSLSWSALGEPRCLYPRFDASGNLVNIEMYRGGEAIFDKERHGYTAEFGMAPEEVAKIPLGHHTFRAVMEIHSRLPWRRSERFVSNPVTVTVQKPADLTPGAEDLEWSRLVESAKFYLRAKKYEDAQRVALQLIEQRPKDVDNHILLGDALNGLRRDQEALKSYKKALFLIAIDGQQHREPPTYVYMRMEEVQQRFKH